MVSKDEGFKESVTTSGVLIDIVELLGCFFLHNNLWHIVIIPYVTLILTIVDDARWYFICVTKSYTVDGGVLGFCRKPPSIFVVFRHPFGIGSVVSLLAFIDTSISYLLGIGNRSRDVEGTERISDYVGGFGVVWQITIFYPNKCILI